MFQPNLPSVYQSLKNANPTRMKTVTIWGTGICVVLYVSIGIFGYLTVVGTPQEDVLVRKSNILEVSYSSNKFFTIAVGALLFAVFFATPLQVLPAKDALESMLFTKGMSKSVNIGLTTIVVFGCYLVSVLMPSINDALTLIGSTTNPLVGFIFPILFYLKMNPNPT